MQINFVDPLLHTQVFTLIFIITVLLFLKKAPDSHLMSISNTNELKGMAILMVIFSHIGYFLDSGDKFLYPLSTLGGVGVNIFLFLSGFGLTVSALKSNHSILAFYIKRLKKIFIPMWLVLITFLILDYLVLNLSYPTNTIINSFLGFFPNADIYTAVNSPFWYFSLILFYYLIFPLFLPKKYPALTAIFIFSVSFLILHFRVLTNLVDKDVLKLYKLHYLAFPSGIMFAALQNSKYNLSSLIIGINHKLRYLLIIPLIFSISYTAIHSGVGEGIKYEQTISLITTILFLFIILLKNFKSNFLILLGVYSYEIYLIQWPLLYRYDFLYKIFPSSLATFLYLGLFLAVGYLMKKLTKIF